MIITAAVLETPGAPLVVRQVELDAPRDDEVLVRLVASGVCHSDLSARHGRYGLPTPVILGHEGSGVVEVVGSHVTSVAAGDHVVLTFASCGKCGVCADGHPAYCRVSRRLNMSGRRPDGTTAYTDAAGDVFGHFVGQSSFATHALVRDTAVVRVPEDLPLELLAPLGCGVQTGAGAVMNRLRPRRGQSLAVVGTGAVGLSAIMAGKLAGCGRIIAVDRDPGRLELASELGATEVVTMSQDTILEDRLRSLTGGVGVDVALDTTAVPALVQELFRSLAVRGMLGLVGSFGSEALLQFEAAGLRSGRRVEGILVGDAVPTTFIPHLIELYRAGRFPFDRMITLVGDLTQINHAFDALESGAVVKAVLSLS